MEPARIAKQILTFQKSAMDNTYEVMVMMQDHFETVSNSLLQQLPWIPDSGKEVVNTWIRACKNGRDSFKQNIDSSFQRVEDFFSAFDGEKE